MRPLTETETKTLFDKLANYTGSSLKNLIAPLDDSADADRYVFRLVRDRVYYVLLSIANLATSIARENLSSLGVCLGMHDWRLPPPPPASILLSPRQPPKLPHLTHSHPILTSPSPPPYRQIHQNRQIPAAHHSAANPRRARAVQGMDPAERGDAVPVRGPRGEGARGAVHRGHARAPGRRRPQHGRQAPRFRRHRT